MSTLKLMVSAGEASGDLHAAHVLSALSERGHKVDVFGMGAGALAAEGMDIVVDCRDLAVIGFVDVLLNYHRFMARLATLRRAMKTRRPDVVVLVDYPDFNLKLAKTARELGIPVLFYVSPQVWAWRSGRVKRIGELVSHMAVLFPFEEPIYRQAGIPVTYVGNPLVDQTQLDATQADARKHIDVRLDSPVVTLLPGSRRGEIQRNLPRMLAAVQILATNNPQLQFVLPMAETVSADELHAILKSAEDTLPDIRLLAGESLRAMRAANVALVASGTATLETALIGTPLVVMYVVAPLNYAIMKRLIRIPDISLVNIVAQRRVVPEFLQDEASGENLAAAVQQLLDDDTARAAMLTDLAEVKQRMGQGGASEKVADLVLELAEPRS